MSFNKKNGKKEGLEPSWWFVLGALVVGLCIPDKFNPIEMLFSKFKKKDEDKKDEPKH